MENLLKIHDLPKKRAELLGEACLKLIKKYSQENQLLTDEFDTAQNPLEKFNEVKHVIHIIVPIGEFMIPYRRKIYTKFNFAT